MASRSCGCASGEEGQRWISFSSHINVLSKYAWVVPFKDKTVKSLVDASDAVFKKDGGVPERLQTDAGNEFLNKEFQRFLTSKNVHHFVSYNETKAQIVERFNRTLKNRMCRYFTFQNGSRYVEALPALVEGCNKAYHRSIGTAPEPVTQANAQEIWHRLYGKDFVKRSTRVCFKFKVGDKVCISKKKAPFEKGYLPNWTEEVFSIAQRLRRIPRVYRLREYNGTMLDGPFTNANSNEFNNRRPTCSASKKYSRPVEKRKMNSILYVGRDGYRIRSMACGFVVVTFVNKKINKASYPLRVSVFSRMAHLQHDDVYLVLPSHARCEGVHDNRPQHFKVDLPKELFLEGEWEVGVTELLYTHTFYEPSRFALTYDLSDSDLMWEFTNRNVHHWIAVHFPRELYRDKR